MRSIYCAIVALLISGNVAAQYNFGVKYFGLSMHPKGDKQANLMPHKLDDKGVFVVNFGTILSFQQFIYRELVSVKVAQGIYTDSGGLPSGHTHVGFRTVFFEKGKNNISLGFGPTLIYRRNWNVKEGYVSTGLFKESGNIQYKLVMYGGEFEYNRYLNEHFDLSVNFLPGYPLVMSLGVGIRWWPAGH